MFLALDGFGGGAVVHGFFGRRGGVSGGPYESLNCNVRGKDDPSCVAKNRRRACAALGVAAAAGLHQVHADCCVFVENCAGLPEADAMVTDRAGLALGILTADCVPVLFCGAKADGAPVIGAAHAGWAGALKGVIGNTVRALCAAGAIPESLRAAVGPCIGPDSYEVGPGFDEPFLKAHPESARFFRAGAREGHLMFDLPGYVVFCLEEAGIAGVVAAGHDTFAREGDYFSHRRATLRGEGDCGRQIAMVAIRA